MSILQNPIIVGLLVGLPTIILGILAYRRSVKLDQAARDAAEALERASSSKMVIDGLNIIIKRLQEDNEVLRSEIRTLRTNFREFKKQVEESNK